MPALTREQIATRRHARHRSHRRRRRALLSVVSSLLMVAVVLVGLGLAAGGATSEAATFESPVPSTVAGVASAPAPLVIARADGVDVHLPVSLEALTAVGYHPVNDPDVVPLEPAGSVEYGTLARNDRPGSPTASVDVGAPAGTAVYAPVDGTIASVSDYTVKGHSAGYELTIAVASTGSLVARMNHLQPTSGGEPPRVGQDVVAGQTVLGEVRDLSAVGEQQLSELTSDAGNHVNLELVRVEVGGLP